MGRRKKITRRCTSAEWHRSRIVDPCVSGWNYLPRDDVVDLSVQTVDLHLLTGFVSDLMRARVIVGLIGAALCMCTTDLAAIEPWLSDPASSRKTQDDAMRRIPFNQLNPAAAQNIREVVDRPSFFRRMPTQAFACDQELFTFLVRYPEVLVNIWDLMDITKVTVDRNSPYVFTGQDGAGTTCKCDLVYGTPEVHIYHGIGHYKGSMAPREITGKCVCVLHSTHTQPQSAGNRVTGTMDVYLKLDNLGADLITRTLGPFVGKTADYNFVESAKFVSQISEVCERNPVAAQNLASRLSKIRPEVRQQFATIAANISATSTPSVDAHQFASTEPLRPKPTETVIVPLIEQNLDSSSRDTTSLKFSDQLESRSSSGTGVAPRKSRIYMRR